VKRYRRDPEKGSGKEPRTATSRSAEEEDTLVQANNAKTRPIRGKISTTKKQWRIIDQKRALGAGKGG